jgi:two-component system, NtrC family, sensor kinase
MPDPPPVLTGNDDAALADPEVRQLREKLAEAYRLVALGQLVTGVVHEINNPIGSIFSNNEVSLRALASLRQKLDAAREAGEPPPQKAIDLVETLLSLAAVDKIACERISGVVRTLKTLSRAEERDVRKARVNDLLRDAAKLVDCQYRRRIDMRLELEDTPEIECYPQLLSQVFLNLLVNAGQAIEDEGLITVRCRLAPDAAPPAVEIAIQDSGRGIAPEHQSRIFEAGFTTKPVGVGTGLGLALSRKLIEESHHGRIWFTSEPGRGTAFYVQVPVRQPREASP